MCGIVGLWHRATGAPAPAETLARMAARLAHRGPDGRAARVEGSFGLATARLAIIDPPGGAQPMATPEGRFQIALNGEIYNHAELRAELRAEGVPFRTTSDTEAALSALARWGVRGLERLTGMFALAFFDAREQTLLLARDRFGEKPLFWREAGDALLFGSETGAFPPECRGPSRTDSAALAGYLADLVPPAGEFWPDAVHSVPPAHALLFRAGAAPPDKLEYWRLDATPRDPRGDDAEQALALLRRAVRLCLVADVPVGVLLSGGVDSSLVAALAVEAGARDLVGFCAGFADADHDERSFARAAARRLGLRLEETVVAPPDPEELDRLIFSYDGPFADSSAIPTWAVARLAARSRKAVLAGDGGDEMFGGYRRYRARLLTARYNALPRVFRRALLAASRLIPEGHGAIGRSAVKQARKFLASAEEYERAPWRSTVAGFSGAQIAALVPGLSPFLATPVRGERRSTLAARAGADEQALDMRRRDLVAYLPDDLLVKVDRAAMAHSLEVRLPFLNHDLAAFAARLPRAALFTTRRSKPLLKRVAARYLPTEIVHRPKQGFAAPLGRWIRGPWREMFRAALTGKGGGSLPPGFNRSFVARMVEEHLALRADHGERLYALYVLARWWQARPEALAGWRGG
ncbi:MAG: asparagine synthase (glutamine-hydrolyzing) [Planctomycetes bacterium]|nr:asparagine synthase (glutamine-hydrolyzing) [Planctomycetota bacterium]